MPNDRNGFLIWLTENKGYSIKSARDVLSRFKRVKLLLRLDRLESRAGDEIVLLLNRNAAYCGLSGSVRSQIKKSVYLVKEFESNNARI